MGSQGEGGFKSDSEDYSKDDEVRRKAVNGKEVRKRRPSGRETRSSGLENMDFLGLSMKILNRHSEMH